MRFLFGLLVFVLACGTKNNAADGGGGSGGGVSGGAGGTSAGAGSGGASSGTAGSGGGGAGRGGTNAGGTSGGGTTGGRGGATPDGSVPDASGDAPRPTPRLTWTLTTPGWDASFISGAANGEVWIADRSGSALQIRADGTSSATDLQLSTSAHVTGLWVAGPNNAYISAYANLVLHWDGGGTWKRDIMTSGTLFNSVWGSSPADVYAVTDLGVYHTTGDDKWTLQPITETTLSGLGWLTGTGPTDLWLAGDHGEIFRSTGGGTWRRETSTGVYYVNQLWAATPNEAYFVTYLAVMHRLPSSGSWVAETAPVVGDERINTIWGSGSNDVYAGTDKGRLLHSVGDGVWQDDGFNGNVVIHAIWGRNASDVYLATSGGVYHGAP